MEIPFEGQIKQEDFSQAYSLFHKLPKPIVIIGGGIILFIIGVFIIGLIRSPSWSALPTVIMILVLGFLGWWIFRFTRRDQWKSNEAFQNPISGIVSNQGIRMTGTNFTSEVSWELYRTYKISSDMVILYQSSFSYNVFPKSLFQSEDDWETFVELVEEKIPENKGYGGFGRIGMITVIGLVIIVIYGFIKAMID